MFRYTPPWQVLCNHLGHEFKRQSSDSTCDESTQVTRQVVSTDQSHRFLRPPGLSHFPDHPQSRVSMTSTPKRWVIKPFSPKLDQSDLRSMVSPTDPQPSPESFRSSSSSSSSRHDESFRFSAESISVTGTQPSVIMSPRSQESTPDVLVRARQVAVSEDGSDSEDLSSSGSHNGFYSFVEDPASPEAEMNEAYMASPTRLAKLNTLKEKDTFRLQTYTEEKKPGRLFEEASEDTQYHIEKVFTDDREEDNPDRLEIIRNQAPRKSPALKEQWSALENLDLSSTTQRLLEGFSLSYKHAKPKPEQVRSDHGIIECEQIDFNTARKQFLLMEQSQPGSLPQSPQQLPYISKDRGRSLSSTASIFTSEKHKVPVQPTTQKESELTFVTKTEDPVEAPRAALYDVDHADGAGDNNSDESNSTISSVSEIESSFSVFSTGETPIQKEIRIAQEREENLRRSRGILRSNSSEMVEIKSKPFLSQSSPRRKAPRSKEGNRVSFLIQQQQQSKDGAWDNLPTSIKTNPQRFPNLQQPSSPEEDSTETLSPCYPHQHPDDYTTECKTDSEKRVVKENGLGNHSRDFSMGIQTSISENKKLHFPKTPSFMNPTKFLYCPTWSSHDEHSNWSSKMQNAPQSIRQEIEEGLRREQELQHFRESNSLCISWTSSKLRSSLTGTDAEASEEFSSQSAQRNDTDVDMMTQERKLDYSSPYMWSGEPPQSSGADKYPQFSSPQPSFRQPSVSIVTPQPWVSPKPLSPSVSRLNPIKHLGLPDAPSPTAQKGLTETLLRDYEDRRVKLKMDESAYAGIQPVDEINNEVVEATRVIRHKNQKALQWEAGMYANQESQ